MFVGGGNTFRLLSCLYADGVMPLIQQRVNDGSLKYIGSSAGSNNSGAGSSAGSSIGSSAGSNNSGASGRPPAIGLYVLAGDEDTAVRRGSFVLAKSGFSRVGVLVWEVDVPAALVPWVLVACTYSPKVAGSFRVSVERQEVDD